MSRPRRKKTGIPIPSSSSLRRSYEYTQNITSADIPKRRAKPKKLSVHAEKKVRAKKFSSLVVGTRNEHRKDADMISRFDEQGDMTPRSEREFRESVTGTTDLVLSVAGHGSRKSKNISTEAEFDSQKGKHYPKSVIDSRKVYGDMVAKAQEQGATVRAIVTGQCNSLPTLGPAVRKATRIPTYSSQKKTVVYKARDLSTHLALRLKQGRVSKKDLAPKLAQTGFTKVVLPKPPRKPSSE